MVVHNSQTQRLVTFITARSKTTYFKSHQAAKSRAHKFFTATTCIPSHTIASHHGGLWSWPLLPRAPPHESHGDESP